MHAEAEKRSPDVLREGRAYFFVSNGDELCVHDGRDADASHARLGAEAPLHAVSLTRNRQEGEEAVPRFPVPSQNDEMEKKRADEVRLDRALEGQQRHPRCHLILYAQGTDRPGVSLQFARWLAAEGYEDEEIELEWKDWGVQLVDVRQIKVGTMCCLYYHVKLNQHVAMEVLKACLFTAAQVHYELDYQLLPSHPRRLESSFASLSFARLPTSPSCSLCYSPSPSQSVRGPLAAEEEREEIEAERSLLLKDGVCSVSPRLASRVSAPSPSSCGASACSHMAARHPSDPSNPPSAGVPTAPGDLPPSPSQACASPHAASHCASPHSCSLYTSRCSFHSSSHCGCLDCISRRQRSPWEIKASLSGRQLREAVRAAATLAAEAAAGAALAAQAAAEAVSAADFAGEEDVGKVEKVTGKVSFAVQAAAEAKAKAAAAEGTAYAVEDSDASGDPNSQRESENETRGEEEANEKRGEKEMRDRKLLGDAWRETGNSNGSGSTQHSSTDGEASGRESRGMGRGCFRDSPTALREAHADPSEGERAAARAGLSAAAGPPSESMRQREGPLREARREDGGAKRERDSEKPPGWPGLGFPRWSDVVVVHLLQTRPALAAALLADVLAALLRATATVQSMGLERVDLGNGGAGEKVHSVEIKVQFPASLLPFQTKVPRDKPAINALEDELRNICKRHDAQMLLRWDDFALKRKCHSLVVFGLNEVLVEQDVMDAMLQCNDTQIDLDKFSQSLLQEHGGVASEERMYMRKLTKLKGARAADLVKKVLPHLTIARGAFFLMFVLKKLGVRTALMTHSCQEVAHCVGRLLGIDYVLSNHFEVREGVLTGRVVGGSSSSEVTTSHMLDPLRKMDWLQLLRDKERLERDALFVLANYENFDFLHGAAGFCFSFNARRDRDISKFLLLLGMKNRHLQEFHSTFVASAVEASLDLAYPLGLTALVQRHQVSLLSQFLQPSSRDSEEESVRNANTISPPDVGNLQTEELRKRQRLRDTEGSPRPSSLARPTTPVGPATPPGSTDPPGPSAPLQRRKERREGSGTWEGKQEVAARKEVNGDTREAREKEEGRGGEKTQESARQLWGKAEEQAERTRSAEGRPESGICHACSEEKTPLVYFPSLSSSSSLASSSASSSSSSSPSSSPASAFVSGKEGARRDSPTRKDECCSASLERMKLAKESPEERQGLRVTSSVSSAASNSRGERRVDRAVVCVYGQVRSNDATPQLWRIIEALRPFEQGRSGGGSSGVCTPASVRGVRGGTSSCGIEALQLVNLHHHICLGMTLSWMSQSSKAPAPHRLTSSGSGRSDSFSSLPPANVAAAAVAALTLSSGGGVSSAAPLFPRVSSQSLGLPALASPSQHLSPVKEVLFVASCLGLKASFIPQLPPNGRASPYPPGVPVSPSASLSSLQSWSPEEKRRNKAEEDACEREAAAAKETDKGESQGAFAASGTCHGRPDAVGDGLGRRREEAKDVLSEKTESWAEKRESSCDNGESLSEKRESLTEKREEGSARSFYLVVMEEPSVSPQLLVHIFALLYDNLINIEEIDRLSLNVAKAIRLRVAIGPLVDVQQLKKQLLSVCSDFGADVALQADDISRYCLRLVVFDMDSTLVCEEVIDELAREAGVMDEVAAITQAAMEGHLDFHASLMQRVKMLKGIKRSALDAVAARLTPTPGAAALCRILRHLGYRLAVISGGFTYFARKIKKLLKLHHAFANHLQIDPCTGTVTGEVEGPVVTAQRKVSLMRMLAEVEQVQVDQVIAVGDGSNDIPLLLHAGMGVAFCAKKRVKENSNYQLNQRNLFLLVHLLGISEKDALQLAQVEDVRDD
ncbi:UNVERIFIED_CONTAM: phosphoserine phosphatase [Hammondia hammondi]|eukprot:XP_008886174.1 phosphoserine phosphatase [Hammondia hammondi]